MSDLEFLYAVLVAFYLWECTHWLRLAAVPFVSWVGERFHVTAPFFVATGREAGCVFASPIPFLGTFFISAELPVAVSPSGVANDVGTRLSFTDQPRFAARRQCLMVNRQPLAKATSAAHARWLAAQLNDISMSAEAEREGKVMDLLSATLDSRQVADRLTEFNRTARLSATIAGGLFVYVFIAAPTLIWRLGLALAWPWLLGGLILLVGINAVTFFRAHKRLHAGLEDERFSHFLMALLFPPAAMRAQDMLSRPLLERFHPLASAIQLCDADGVEALAGRTLRELRYPSSTKAIQSPEARAVWEGYRQRLLRAVEDFVARKGLSAEKLEAPPDRSEPGSKTYCPRCHAQFTRTDGTCSDCGVTLVEFR